MGSIPIPSSNLNSKPDLAISRSTLNDQSLDLSFEKWVKQKYAKSYSRNILIYTKKYSHLLKADSNLRELELLHDAVKNNVIKSLLILAKYNGCYSELKNRLKQYGIKASKPSSLDAFLRILNASNSDILEYYQRIQPFFRANEQLYTKFLLQSGLRVSEAIASFNLIIELSKIGKLSEYYNADWRCLMHFKYKEKFIRGTKNAYLTFITKDFLEHIANSQPVSYHVIKTRLWRKKQPLRLDEFRDFFGTQLINNGILEAEQNLVCGRIPISIFIRHYWSPKLGELGDRVLNAISKMEFKLN
jgi:intergrase/recombinase